MLKCLLTSMNQHKILDISQKQHHVIYVNTKISWREPAPDCDLYCRIYVQFNWNSFMGKLMICHVVDSLVMSHIAKFLIGVLRKYISCILHYAPRFYKVHDLDTMIPRFVTEKCTIVITDDIFKWSCWKLCGSMIGICNFLCPESIWLLWIGHAFNSCNFYIHVHLVCRGETHDAYQTGQY